MTSEELRAIKVDLLDEVHELAEDPVADPEPLKSKIEALFSRLETLDGEARTEA